MTSFQVIRTIDTGSAQAAEGLTPPVDASLVPLTGVSAFTQDGGRVQSVELSFGALTDTGSPTSVKFGIWRRSEGVIHKLATYVVLLADYVAPPPVIVPFHGDAIWVTVESFVAGSTPKVAGVISARPVRVP